MKITETEKRNAWCMFAAGALAGIANLSSDSEIVDECDVVAEYADRMLANFEDSFECDDDE